MAKNIVITNMDKISQGGDRTVHIERNDLDIPGDYDSTIKNYDDLSADAKTKLDAALAALEAEL